MSARSALWITAVLDDAVLFAVLESISVALMVAVLVIVVPATANVGVTMIITVAVPPLLIVPRPQVTVLVPVHVPWLAEAENRVTPEGSVSIRLTFVAGSGPLFPTVIV